jgi:hypothetical protein
MCRGAGLAGFLAACGVTLIFVMGVLFAVAAVVVQRRQAALGR